MATRAVIFGCEGAELTALEAGFFAEADPLGFILFARNCVAPEQVRALVVDLRQAVGRADAPVLIDQEGGRVQRLNPPAWRAAPPPGRFGELAESDHARGLEAARLNARLIAAELAGLGITVDCLPLLDLRFPEAHEIIGDRSYGTAPDLVAALGRACCEGLLAGGVLPVVKHIPGHGRALVDSHAELPRVETPLEELQQVLAGVALEALGLLEHPQELPVAQTVGALELLRLAELQAEIGDLLPAVDVHARRVFAPLDGAFGREAARSLQMEGDTFSTTDFAE